MCETTLELVLREAEKYNVKATFAMEKMLPSFQISNNTTTGVVIAAPSEIELLYGVYDYAERFGGWSFFELGQDGYDARNRTESLPAGILREAKQPLLKRRGFIQEFAFDYETESLFDYMAKNKLNYLQTWMKYYDVLSDELKKFAALRGIEIESGHHNFNYWIPGEKYGKTHPEFFAEINGKRIKPTTDKSTLLLSEQICTTNPKLRREIVKNMLDYCDKHPELKTIALIPNDGFGWCECPECSKLYDVSKKGDLYSVSAHVYKANGIFHNLVTEISAAIHARRPDINLAFCAYVNYTTPAEGFALQSGNMLHFAPYWRCINHDIDDSACPINSRYAEDIKAWERVKHGGEINIYEYYMGVNFYLSLPMVHFNEMFREMRFYAQHHVDGIMTQFHISHWSVYGVNYYLMSRAARGDDAEESISEMLGKVFGNSEQQAREFYLELKNLLYRAGPCHIPYPYSLLSRTCLADYRRIYEKALLLNKYCERPICREIVIWCDYMVRFKKLFDAYHNGKCNEEMVKKFLQWIHLHVSTRVFVHSKFDRYFEALLDAMQNNKPWLHFNIAWEDEYIRLHKKTLNNSCQRTHFKI